jgi:transcriptional regulator with XRE-family HTH domain
MLEKRIADTIRQIGNDRGITLAQRGEEAGLSKGLLSRIEDNQVSPPIPTLSRIARKSGVHLLPLVQSAARV